MTRNSEQECDYCGEHGHTWRVHEEAQSDVIAWQREQDAEAQR